MNGFLNLKLGIILRIPARHEAPKHPSFTFCAMCQHPKNDLLWQSWKWNCHIYFSDIFNFSSAPRGFFSNLTPLSPSTNHGKKKTCYVLSDLASYIANILKIFNINSHICLLLTSLTSLISFIFDPPLPMSEPHWLAGTMSLIVTGGFGTPLFGMLLISWKIKQIVCLKINQYNYI